MIYDLKLLRKIQNLKTQNQNHKRPKTKFYSFFKTKQNIKTEAFKHGFDSKYKHKIWSKQPKID